MWITALLWETASLPNPRHPLPHQKQWAHPFRSIIFLQLLLKILNYFLLPARINSILSWKKNILFKAEGTICNKRQRSHISLVCTLLEALNKTPEAALWGVGYHNQGEADTLQALRS